MSSSIKNTAKLGAVDRLVSTIAGEARKDALQLQEINRAIAEALHPWLAGLDEPTRIKFFAALETSSSAAVARKIERHPMRPAAVTPLVKTAREQAERQKEAQKDEDARLRKERDMAKLAELKKMYESKAPEETLEVNA